MKLLFLDVDGVLNTATTQGPFEETCLNNFKTIFDRFEEKEPNEDLQIVLSSTWKYLEKSRDKLLVELTKYGIINEKRTCFISQTPDLRLAGEAYPKENIHSSRTDEILCWLKINTISEKPEKEPGFLFPLGQTEQEFLELNDPQWNGPHGEWKLETPLKIKNFVILDDMLLTDHGCFGPRLTSQFVRTNIATGLTEENIEQVLNTLCGKFDFQKWRKISYTECTNPNCLMIKPETPSPKRKKWTGIFKKSGSGSKLKV